MLNVRHPRSNVAVIDIQGEVTARTEDLLANAFAAASSGGIKTIVLNFGGLEYMNSSGIGLLVTLLIRAQRNKQKLLAYGLSDHYQQIFQLTRLDEAIEIYEDEAGALAAAE
jgi:anti-sigma B factor antagonist